MPKVMESGAGVNRRHHRGRRSGPTLSEINVIPLVDVMLVLLIIFMVAAPMLQRGIEVNLPVSARSQQIPEKQLYLDIPSPSGRTIGSISISRRCRSSAWPIV